MNSRRKTLLVVLFILLLLPVVVGGIGAVELTLWLVLLAGWLVAFIFWGGRSTGTLRH